MKDERYKEIFSEDDIDTLKEGDRVRFCINDLDDNPAEAEYIGRNGLDLVFEGESRNEKRDIMKFGVQRHELSPLRGRIHIQERVTIRIYE